jgi:hypothetical protein
MFIGYNSIKSELYSVFVILSFVHPGGLIELLTILIFHLLLVPSRLLLLLMHNLVGLLHCSPIVLHMTILCCRSVWNIFLHSIVPGLWDNLSLSIVTLAGILIWLLNGIHTKDLIVGFLFKILKIIWDLKALGYHTNLTRAIESCVLYLGLKWKVFKLSQV